MLVVSGQGQEHHRLHANLHNSGAFLLLPAGSDCARIGNNLMKPEGGGRADHGGAIATGTEPAQHLSAV